MPVAWVTLVQNRLDYMQPRTRHYSIQEIVGVAILMPCNMSKPLQLDAW